MKLLPGVLVLWLLWCPAFAGPGIKPESPGAEGERAFRELGSFYQSGKDAPDYTAALVGLSSANAVTRDSAGRFLLALLTQSFADELNGRADWQSLPYWGGGAESAARDFRKKLEEDCAQKAGGEAALDALLWLIGTEKLADGAATAAQMLPRIDSPRMEKVLGDLLVQPHPNGALVVAAIQEVDRRKLVGLIPRVKELRGFYRKAIRKAARKVAPEGATAYVPADAFSPWLIAQLTAIREMLPVAVPADAKWVQIPAATEGQRSKLSGWLLGEKGGNLEILTWFGRRESVPAASVKPVERNLTAVAAELIALQKLDDGQLSISGDFSAQFEGAQINTPAGLVAAWCIERGDRATAAEVLFPSLDSMADDRWLTWIMRDRLGHTIHQEMLEVFSYQRDYPATLVLADHLSKPVFDGFQYQDRAKELAVQLRQRGGDFTTLTLPRPEAWQKLLETMSRVEQIGFLAARLRLMNCFQQGQPADIDYSDEQSAAPNPFDEDKPVIPVMNPFVELADMHITIAELPALIPALADENFAPTFSYWRTFVPERELLRVNTMVVEIVNAVAKRRLANLRKFKALDEAGRHNYLEGLQAWCRTNATKSSADLLLATLAESKDWLEFEDAAVEAIRENLAGAPAVLIARIGEFPERSQYIAEIIAAVSAPEVLQAARQWVKSGDNGLRSWGALVLVRDGDKTQNEGFAELRAALEKDQGGSLYRQAIAPLVARNDPDSLALACGFLKTQAYDRDKVLSALISTGRQVVLDYLLAGLDDNTRTGSWSGKWRGKQVSRQFTRGDHFAGMLASLRRDGFDWQSDAPDEERAVLRAQLKRWLPEIFALIRAGKPVPLNLPANENR